MGIEPIDGIMTITKEGRFKNGRKIGRESKVGRNFAAIAGTYLILLFLIPLSLPTDSIPDLSGRANRFDYATIDGTWSWGNNDSDYEHAGHNQSANGGSFAWTDQSNCSNCLRHWRLKLSSKHYRSWEINGNQLAVCVRMLNFLDSSLLFNMAAEGLEQMDRARYLPVNVPDES